MARLGGVMQCASAADTSSVASQDAFEAEIFECSNAFRQWRGCSPVGLHTDLCARARSHAAAMASGTAPFSHAGAHERFSSEEYVHFAENLARAENVENLGVAVVDGWIASPGHCRNLLGPFNAVGIGIAFRYSEKGRVAFATQLLAYVPAGPHHVAPRPRILDRLWPTVAASSLALQPALGAACAGLVVGGPLSAAAGAATVFGLEVGAGFRVSTAPQAASRLALARVGLNTVHCARCAKRTAPLLHAPAATSDEWVCDECSGAESGDPAGDWWLVNRAD